MTVEELMLALCQCQAGAEVYVPHRHEGTEPQVVTLGMVCIATCHGAQVVVLAPAEQKAPKGETIQ